MKIAYDSAYVQIETLNFTFFRQADVQADCFLPVISDCTLIASKTSIQHFGTPLYFFNNFLADRTIGRAYGTVCHRSSVVCRL